MDDIIRNPTPEEKMDFIPIATRSGKVISPEIKLAIILAEEGQKALKKGLPFAAQVARDDWKEAYESQIKASKKKHGSVDPADIKLVEMDFSKYSNLKNFDVIEEGDKFDEHLSKRSNLQVFVKFTIYRFKGYSNTYIIMEDPYNAIDRARELQSRPRK